MAYVKKEPKQVSLIRRENETVVSTYYCPCGKGEIIEENDYRPGFRDLIVFIDCVECSSLYEIEYSASGLAWKLKERNVITEMTRRKPYSKVVRSNKVETEFAKGKGDKLYRGFQCLNPHCNNYIFIPDEDITEDFEIECPRCGFIHKTGNTTKFFDYEVQVEDQNRKLVPKENGEFVILHDDYIEEAKLYKYCIICGTLKPIEDFDIHNSRKSGRQGECRLCKKIYNGIKNGTRISDQHREAAQKRRLLLNIAGSPKIHSAEIENRFDHKCFNCGKDLSNVTANTEKPLDHTLPVYYLWPLTTENATLLCHDCNGNKSGTWPSQFYSDEQLKRLSVLTGISYDALAGEPFFNPDAIEFLKVPENVDNLLTKFAHYMNEVIRLRNRILKETGFDFFQYSRSISQKYIDEANALLEG